MMLLGMCHSLLLDTYKPPHESINRETYADLINDNLHKLLEVHVATKQTRTTVIIQYYLNARHGEVGYFESYTDGCFGLDIFADDAGQAEVSTH